MWSANSYINDVAQPRASKSRTASRFARVLLLLFFVGVCAQSAYAGLTITPVTWNVIGIDSNNPAVGPDTYQIGARVCNTGGAAVSNLVGTFVWDSTNIYINPSGNK